MNEQGQRIYFLKNNGNVIYITGEMTGWITPTTIDEDFGNYSALKEYNREVVGVIEFKYGELRQLMSDNNADSVTVDVSDVDNPTLIYHEQPPIVENKEKISEKTQPIKTLDEIIDEKIKEVKAELSTAITEIIENTEATKVELSTAITEVIEMMTTKEG